MPQFNLDTYVDVQERINRFWSEYPEGAIRTRLMSPPDDWTTCRYEAAIYKHTANGAPDATGYAFEQAGGGSANRTSHEENCETSAIGRALANMGYAKTRDDRPSRQEMGKVVRMQAEPGRLSHEEADRRAAADPPRPSSMGAPGADDMSRAQYGKIAGMAKEAGFVHEGHLDDALLLQRVQERFGCEWPHLSKRQASQVIEAFNAGALLPYEPDVDELAVPF